VEVIGDARITDPGCVLETDAGLIDATVESQLAAIRRGLERSLAQPNQSEA
jgi:type III secretion protein L